MMMRRDLLVRIGGFDSRLAQAHDFDMWVKCCLQGKNIYVFNEKLAQYRRLKKNKNMSSNTSAVQRRLIFDNEKILENFLTIDVSQLIEIFPNLTSQKNFITQNLIPFFIAQQALTKNTIHHQQFALSSFYKIMGDEKIAETLEKKFDFSLKKFFEVVTANPLGSMSEKIENNFCHKFVKKIRKFFKGSSSC